MSQVPKGRPAWALDLKKKEWDFIEQYLLDLNNVQAWCRAFAPELSPIKKNHEKYATFRASAYQMRKKPHVAAALDKAFAERGITRPWIINQLAKIARFDPADLFDEKGNLLPVRFVPDEARYCIVGVSPGEWGTEYKLADKLAALNALAKASRLFVDRVEVSGPEGVPFTDPFDAAMKLADSMALRLQPPKEESKDA